MKLLYWLPVFAAVALVGPRSWAQTGDDLDKSLASLKEASASKNTAQVKKLAVETIAMARKAEAEPAPDIEEAKAAWKDRVAYLKNVETQCEYALGAAALQVGVGRNDRPGADARSAEPEKQVFG